MLMAVRRQYTRHWDTSAVGLLFHLLHVMYTRQLVQLNTSMAGTSAQLLVCICALTFGSKASQQPNSQDTGTVYGPS